MNVAKEHAKRVYDNAVSRIGPEAAALANISVDRIQADIEASKGPHLSESAVADIMIKLFELQWANLKTE